MSDAGLHPGALGRLAARRNAIGLAAAAAGLVRGPVIGEAASMLLPAAAAQTKLIEVVRIPANRDPWPGELVGEGTALWEEGQVHQALALIAALPEGERQRCFFPGWGIRARSESEPLFEIEFCFRCEGARLRGPAVPAGQQGIQTFAPDSAPGRALLALFQSTDPS